MILGANLYGKLCGGGIAASRLQNAAVSGGVNNIGKQVTCTMFGFLSILSVIHAAKLVAVGATELFQVR